jgi:hypothetical protein
MIYILGCISISPCIHIYKVRLSDLPRGALFHQPHVGRSVITCRLYATKVDFMSFVDLITRLKYVTKVKKLCINSQMKRKYYFVSVSFVVFLDFQVKQILLDFIRDCGEPRFKQLREVGIYFRKLQ